ncbi:alpha/beta hydrolase family protein [Motilibacter peucedani]|uniref:Alpha/beta hydrolase family protein n=1 Tax=Motilibacter peucedani TaxID=598650 RepID=A0A420XND4_9ACTN|nr:alpha/beta hydrolase [Motilibacter peucedani]RKS72786.1 alpha/beta hydrolase family protein [Motilibacter peucedani]
MVERTRVVAGEVTLAVKTWRTRAESPRRTVVLLPATAETADDWDVVAAALVDTRTVHAVDLRGHGGSDWPGTYSVRLLAADVAALLPRLSAEPVDLVAHSLGGLVALAATASRPELVRRLVLEDVGLLRPRTPAPPSRPPGELAFDWRVVEQVRPEVDDPDPRWRQVVATVPAPTLVIGGGASSSIPQEQVADLVGAMPDARLVTIDAGHLVHEHQPQAFIETLRGFLDGPLPHVLA